jgi:hypothetical protein
MGTLPFEYRHPGKRTSPTSTGVAAFTLSEIFDSFEDFARHAANLLRVELTSLKFVDNISALCET